MEELVNQCVGHFLDWKGLGTDRAEELRQVAATKHLEARAANPDLTTPELRVAIRNALTDHCCEDALVAVPRTTRTRLAARGQAVPELNWLQGDDGWEHRQATLNPEAEWLEIVELYQYLYSLCRDDLDRHILETRWDDGQCLLRGTVDARVVARECRVSRTTVYERLSALKRRYFLYRNQGQYRSLDSFCRSLHLPRAIRPRIAELAGGVTNFYRFLSPPDDWSAVSDSHRALHFVWLLRDRHDAAEQLDLIERLMPRVGRGEIEKPFRYVRAAMRREARVAA